MTMAWAARDGSRKTRRKTGGMKLDKTRRSRIAGMIGTSKGAGSRLMLELQGGARGTSWKMGMGKSRAMRQARGRIRMGMTDNVLAMTPGTTGRMIVQRAKRHLARGMLDSSIRSIVIWSTTRSTKGLPGSNGDFVDTWPWIWARYWEWYHISFLKCSIRATCTL